MSFKLEEYEALVNAFLSGDRKEFTRLAKTSDPESVKEALDYLGIWDIPAETLTPGFVRVPTGKEKPKEQKKLERQRKRWEMLSKSHAKTAKGEKTWFKKRLKKAKTLKDKVEIKMFRTARLVQLRKEKAAKKRAKEKQKKDKAQTIKIKELKLTKERYRNQFRKIPRKVKSVKLKEIGGKLRPITTYEGKRSMPYKPRKIGGRKGAYKRKSTEIKHLERELEALKNQFKELGLEIKIKAKKNKK